MSSNGKCRICSFLNVQQTGKNMDHHLAPNLLIIMPFQDVTDASRYRILKTGGLRPIQRTSTSRTSIRFSKKIMPRQYVIIYQRWNVEEMS